jgi:hypothetical protein
VPDDSDLQVPIACFGVSGSQDIKDGTQTPCRIAGKYKQRLGMATKQGFMSNDLLSVLKAFAACEFSHGSIGKVPINVARRRGTGARIILPELHGVTTER